MTDTSTLERPDTVLIEETETEDPSKVNHFFEKVQFDDFYLKGKPMVALCGYVKSTPPQDGISLPVCGKCQWLYDNVVGTNLPPKGDS